MTGRFRRGRLLGALLVVAASGATCAAEGSVDVRRAEPIAPTEAPPTTDAPPAPDDTAPPPTDTAPDTPPPTDPPVDELVASFEAAMVAGGASRPGGPAPRDAELDTVADAFAETVSADGDITASNSELIYTALAEPGTDVEILANSLLWAGEGSTEGDPSATEGGSPTVVEGLDQLWAASPDLLAYGIGGDGTSAVLIARFAPVTDASVPSITAHFEAWVAGLVASGLLPAVTLGFAAAQGANGLYYYVIVGV